MKVSNNKGALRIMLSPEDVKLLEDIMQKQRPEELFIHNVWDVTPSDCFIYLSGSRTAAEYRRVALHYRQDGSVAIETTYRDTAMPFFGTLEIPLVVIESRSNLFGVIKPDTVPEARKRVTSKAVIKKKPTLAETVQAAHAISTSAEIVPIMTLATHVSEINKAKMALGTKLDLKIGKDGLLIANISLNAE